MHPIVFLLGKGYPLIQIRDAMFDLLCGGLQALLPLICNGIGILQRFLDTAVDLRQLLRGKKGAAGDKAGADSKVLFGSCVAVLAH